VGDRRGPHQDGHGALQSRRHEGVFPYVSPCPPIVYQALLYQFPN
jgi:hypothetical protein